MYKDHSRLYKEYFHLTYPVYKGNMFWCRYRMSRDPFMVIIRGIRDFAPTSNAGPMPLVS
jgi:hypothetical protein